MKKFYCVVIVMMTILVLPMLSWADVYYHKVVKGDTATGIARKYKVSIASLGIVDPKGWVYIGQVIPIVTSKANANDPVKGGSFHWKKPGANKFRGKTETAFKLLGLSASEVTELEKMIQSGEYDILSIRPGDRFDRMVFGTKSVKNDVVAYWSEVNKAAWVYKLSTGNEVWLPFICHNWAIKKTSSPPLLPLPSLSVPLVGDEDTISSSEIVDVAPVGPPPAPPYAPSVTSNGTQSDEQGNSDVGDPFDAIMGFGFYRSLNDKSSNGKYFYSKLRYFLWSKETDGIKMDLGVAGFVAGGNGNDRRYDYGWKQLAFGPTFRFIGNGFDGNIDVMFGTLDNRGDVDLYRSHQTDKIGILSMHYNDYHRRQTGESWFPKTEINVEWRYILDKNIDAYWDGNELPDDPDNNAGGELTFTQYIYDFAPLNGIGISPFIDFGFGYEGGDHEYWRVMPGIAVSVHGCDVLQARAFGYKDMLDGPGKQFSYFSLNLDLGQSVKAFRRSQITPPDSDELKPAKVAG